MRVRGSITQGSLTGSNSYQSGEIAARWCRPDAPVLAFVTPNYHSGTGAFGPGSASVSVTADAPLGTRPVTESGTYDLVDQAALAASVHEALLYPANVELREAVRRAIVARLWQDARFADYWNSLIS